MTESEYFEEIESLAVDIVGEIMEGREASECIHETVDSHQWIIYTGYHDEVLACSDNPEAYQDFYCNEDLGRVVSEHGLDHVRMLQAFYAMDYDLGQKVYDLAKEKLEELEEKRDRLESLIEKKEEHIEDLERDIEDLERDIEDLENPSLERFRPDYEKNIVRIEKELEAYQEELETNQDMIANLEAC